MRIFTLFIFILLVSSCSKPVYTVYFDDENHTVFTTKEIKLTTKDNRDLILEVSKICPGRTMCPVSELKLIITLEARFAFLKGKDFFIKTSDKRIDLNHRDYRFAYDITKKAKDGTTGVAIETWTVWIKSEIFSEIANSPEVSLEIGDYSVPFNSVEREPWKIISDNSLLFKTLDEEQIRSYGKYSKSPSTEKEVREKFEKKALMEAEEETWKLIKDSDNKDDLEYFIKQFPNSPYTIPAKLKLNQLNKN